MALLEVIAADAADVTLAPEASPVIRLQVDHPGRHIQQLAAQARDAQLQVGVLAGRDGKPRVEAAYRGKDVPGIGHVGGAAGWAVEPAALLDRAGVIDARIDVALILREEVRAQNLRGRD